MKILLVITSAFLTAGLLCGQTSVKESISTNGKTLVSFDFAYADATITTWNGSNIEIVGTASINEGLNDEAFQLETTTTGQEISVTTFVEDIDKLPQMVTVIKDGQKHIFRYESKDRRDLYEKIKEQFGDGAMSISHGVQTDIKLEIKVPKNLKTLVESRFGDLTLDDVQAAIKVRSTHGSIDAVFENFSGQEIDLASTHRHVDITVPASAALDIDLDSSHGKIFTNLDIQIDKDRSRAKTFAHHIIGTLNSGGTTLRAAATHNNIYLRKATM